MSPLTIGESHDLVYARASRAPRAECTAYSNEPQEERADKRSDPAYGSFVPPVPVPPQSAHPTAAVPRKRISFCSKTLRSATSLAWCMGISTRRRGWGWFAGCTASLVPELVDEVLHETAVVFLVVKFCVGVTRYVSSHTVHVYLRLHFPASRTAYL